MWYYILIFGTAIVFNNCNKNGNDNQNPPVTHTPENEVDMWVTSSDQTKLLNKQDGIIAFTDQYNNYPSISIDTSDAFQTIDGFGYTLTGGSAQLMHGMNSYEREKLLLDIFGCNTDQMCVSYIRVSIGASDLDDEVFSYNDIPQNATDFDLQHFSLSRDTLYLIPILKEALKLRPDLKILASPWSPPVWMKTNQKSIGGSLKPECYDVYADYFLRYLEAMAQHGIILDAVTIQNEPQHGGNNPSMLMSALEQANFIKHHLGPKLRKKNLNTKLVIWDHNCDLPEYPVAILNDPAAKQYIDGSAFHLYNGDISALSYVHNLHPEKNLYFTEQWTGSNGKFGEDLLWHVKHVIIGSMRNWSRVALEWNLANDPGFNPHTPGGCSQCKGAFTIDKNTVQNNVSYYIIAHASKFVLSNSVRVGSSVIDKISNVVFLRPDGKKVMIVVNESQNGEIFNIEFKGKRAVASIPAKSVATLVW